MKHVLLHPLFILFVTMSSLTATASEDGWFGFGLRTELDGFFWKPRLVSASIAVVAPGSPAANARLTVGDTVIEFEGIPVSGAKGDELKKLKAILDKPTAVDDTRRLKLKRANGEIYSVTLTATARPD